MTVNRLFIRLVYILEDHFAINKVMFNPITLDCDFSPGFKKKFCSFIYNKNKDIALTLNLVLRQKCS